MRQRNKNKLTDDQIANYLLAEDTLDIEELDEGDDINLENLDEMLHMIKDVENEELFLVSPKFNISEVLPTETQLSVSPVIPVTTNAEISISPSRDSSTPVTLKIITNNEVLEYD
ncbi:uncharacterized protein LOC112684176 isoform X2 [Sipha flava]|uniref:Uncharacterized protein LOC112684176 isoform X2 n=1 Tax=Sipha flava TaxID=143950 RepID=A0A8B8FL17_9HEMI|nr:uncharacterized protein LOC112684176 isoform X2 [Sipha flava]